MESITIILEESINAQSYGISSGTSDETDKIKSGSTLVHNAEFDRVKNLIRGFIPEDGKKEKEYLHNTITILGTRGSGKTSFLLTIKEILSKKETLGIDIEILDIIDPTLIEEKGHVFLNVITVIKNLVDKRLDSKECNPLDNNSSFSRKEWREALNRLAAGLPSIDGIGNNSADSWQDPEFVMDAGLKAVDASQKLVHNFNYFLKLSLKILNKKAFLLMFDDIDVDARKGWAVLETIRKYFTGERLITIVSGDSQLYSTVVRQNKWQNFGKEILEYEGIRLKKISAFNNMITELESQYLQKVLQPRNRVHLPTIGTGKRHGDIQVYVFKKATDIKNTVEDNEIIKIYDKILRYFGINNGYQARAYRDYLLELPLRTQVQFLSLFKLDSGNYDIEGVNIAPLTDIFLSDLYAKEIDVNTAIRSPKNINRLILNFLLEEKKLEELYQLQPITTEDALNASLLSLNFLLSYNIQKDAYLIFDYFLKIGYTRNLLPLLGYKDSINDTLSPSIEDLCNSTVILNDNVLKDVVGKITSYMRGTIVKKQSNNEKVLQAGTIPLFGLASNTKKSYKVTSDRIDSVLKIGKADSLEQMLVYMPLSSNQYVYKQASLLTYSPYLLLGAIGELIRKDELNDLKNGFTELSQFRGYMMPDFVRGNNKEEIDNVEEESYPMDYVPLPNSFDIELAFSNWVKKFQNIPSNISVHLLGKIATRFFYALTNLESKVRNKNLGEVFHAYILAFMNAVLVEDCRENANDLASELNLNNTNYSDTIFINNINKLTKTDSKKEIEKKLSFSQWMLSCPLLLVYLNNNDKVQKSIKKYCADYLKNDDNDKWEEIFKINIRKFLDEIPIRKEDEKDKVLNKILDGNKAESLSIDNQRNYDEIKARLHSFDIGTLESKSLTELQKELGKFGLKRISLKSVEKYKKYLKTIK